MLRYAGYFAKGVELVAAGYFLRYERRHGGNASPS